MRVTDEAVILAAIAVVIFDRIAARLAGDFEIEAPAASVNSVDPNFATKFSKFAKRGGRLGWSGDGDDADSDWWRK